jgi:hypothetical protein
MARLKSPPACKRCGGECHAKIRVCKDCAVKKDREMVAVHNAAYRQKHAAEIAAQRTEYRAKNAGRFVAANRASAAAWVKANPERHKVSMAANYEANREARIASSAANKAARRAADPDGFKVKEAAYRRKRRQHPKHFVNDKMANRIWVALKRQRGKPKNGSWLQYVDYTLDDLVERLMSTMPAGYCWDDFMSGRLHIDHERPVASFEFTCETDPGFQECWALTNLQLLPAAENIAKGDKLDWRNGAALMSP